ncbi:hypothetical protein LCGC14_0968740 [marine sediment metagenome]|uniref:Uncharacterized protein n=1 Tax=marine sediment metagenome TaxID=412755 RepID=A0A0F9QVG3_9ZZZZ
MLSFFADAYINGFSHDINGKDYFIVPTQNGFLNEYFDLYRPMENIDYAEATSLFIQDFLMDDLDIKTKNKLALTGLEKPYDLLAKKSDAVIDHIFSKYGQYTIYDQFNETIKIFGCIELKSKQEILLEFS